MAKITIVLEDEGGAVRLRVKSDPPVESLRDDDAVTPAIALGYYALKAIRREAGRLVDPEEDLN